MAEILSHEWTLRERRAGLAGSGSGSGSDDASASAHEGTNAPKWASVLGTGPDDSALAASANRFSPSPNAHAEHGYTDASIDEEHDEEGEEERKVARAVGGSAGNRLNADDFKSILKASGTAPDKVKEMMEEYRRALGGKD